MASDRFAEAQDHVSLADPYFRGSLHVVEKVPRRIRTTRLYLWASDSCKASPLCYNELSKLGVELGEEVQKEDRSS